MQRYQRQLSRCFAFGHHGIQRLLLRSLRSAELLSGKRTLGAGRGAWRADQGAELHQRLIERAGCSVAWQRRHQFTRALPTKLGGGCRFDVVGNRIDAGEDARDIAIDERRALGIRQRCNRASGVRTNAGHVAQLGSA